MIKYILILVTSIFLSSNLFAGCMKGEIKQIDAKLENTSISEDKKNEVLKLRKLLVANEHKNSELAFESYEKAMRIFEKEKIKRMPVVEDGDVVGLLTLGNLVTHSKKAMRALKKENNVLKSMAEQRGMTRE